MKKIILGCMLVFFTAGIASAKTSTPAVSQTTLHSIAKYQIDLGDITNKSDQEVKSMINDGFAQIQSSEDDLDCEVTLKGSVKLFFFSVDFTITVRGSCSEMIRDGINVSGLVWAAVRARLLSM